MASQVMTAKDVFISICDQMLPMIRENKELSSDEVSEAILNALAEAEIKVVLPEVSETRQFSTKQVEAREKFRDQTKSNGAKWAVVKTNPEELEFWNGVAKKVPKKANAKTEVNGWQVYQMFGGDATKVTEVDGVVIRPIKA
jgi:hypothetical protein